MPVEVLLISYNALPMDVVSSYRTKAYCDHLLTFGIRPTLLTHRWEKESGQFIVHGPDERELVEENETCTIIRLPNPDSKPSPSRSQTIWSYLNGDLDTGLVNSYRVFRNFLSHHLLGRKYHLIIGIYNPHFHLKLAHDCWRQFKIPYVLDFRDLWNNEIVTQSYQPGLKEGIINFMISRFWRKWIRGSEFFSATGETWKNYLSELSGKEGIVVRNGFDAFPDISQGNVKARTHKFKIIHFGRMYEGQNVDVFIDGFRAFAKCHSPSDVLFEVVGLKRVAGVNYQEKLKKSFGNYVSFVPYMPKSQLIQYCAENASLFFFPNFKEENGQFPVKLYDYISMGRNILVAPAGGEIGDFVLKVGAGVVLNKPEAVTRYLERSYQEFKASGTLQYGLDLKQLSGYSRREQVRIMAEKIHEILARQ